MPVVRGAWWAWLLWCFGCLFVVMVNGCPDWLWNAVVKQGAYGPMRRERWRAGL